MNFFNFNYGNKNFPKWGEIKILQSVFLRIIKHDIFNVYFIDKVIDNSNKIINIVEDTDILLVSTLNSAHSICEIISFIKYYENKTNKIAVSEYFIKDLPFLYELLQIFIPKERFIILYQNTNYLFTTLTTYHCHHFNPTINWNHIPFTIENNSLYFENIQSIKSSFLINTKFLFDKVEEIYNNNKHNYTLYDNVALIKFNTEICTSPSRGFQIINENVKSMMNNIQFISMKDFKNIEHYICVLYHAKNIIFSYGGPCCTNRFFCNPESNVIVLCNMHYKPEYGGYPEKNEYHHVRHSHLIPVKKQTFLLDLENYIDETNVNKILNLLC
jgi:hypothetical protein